MRALVTACFGLLVACGSAAPDASTGADEIVESSTVELLLSPGVAIPSAPQIGRPTAEVLAAVTAGATASAPRANGAGCTLTSFADAHEHPVATRQVCAKSEIVTVLAADGTTKEVHSDLDKDGRIDEWKGELGAMVAMADNDRDGRIDHVVERVDRLSDRDLGDYGTAAARAKFVQRVRDDHDHDGLFEREVLVALGAVH